MTKTEVLEVLQEWHKFVHLYEEHTDKYRDTFQVEFFEPIGKMLTELTKMYADKLNCNWTGEALQYHDSDLDWYWLGSPDKQTLEELAETIYENYHSEG